MRAVFNTQFDNIALVDDHWKHVKGPTTAMIATLLRLRWFPADYDTWLTDNGAHGEVIDLKTTIPYMVCQKIKKAVERRLWESSTLNKQIPARTPTKCQIYTLPEKSSWAKTS